MITLSINYSQIRDSSASMACDGELLFAVAEERISRSKHDARFPSHAIQECLEFTGARADQLDDVCFGWQTPEHGYRHDLKLFATGKWPTSYMTVLSSTRHFLSMWHHKGGAKRFTQDFGATKARMRFPAIIWRLRCKMAGAKRDQGGLVAERGAKDTFEIRRSQFAARIGHSAQLGNKACFPPECRIRI